MLYFPQYHRIPCRGVLLFSIAAALLLSPISLPAQEVLDGVAAVVNSDVITFGQVREAEGSIERSLHDRYKDQELAEKIKEARLSAINDLIDRQLILQEFKKSKLTIPDYIIDDRIQTLIREEFGGDRSAFIRTLEAQGFTISRFRQIEEEKIIVQAMRQRALKTDLVVPPKKVEEYYHENAEEFSTPEQVKLRMIVLKKQSGNPADDREKMAEEIRKKIADGADFKKMAQMYSEDSTAQAEGDWGWVDQKTLNESLTKVAFKLKPGQTSDVLSMGDSYYILYVEAKKNASVKPLEEVRGDIEKKLDQEERQKAGQKWVDGLRKKAYIKMF